MRAGALEVLVDKGDHVAADQIRHAERAHRDACHTLASDQHVAEITQAERRFDDIGRIPNFCRALSTLYGLAPAITSSSAAIPTNTRLSASLRRATD
jgi:hypothetical protein